jgi:hypothetical protein
MMIRYASINYKRTHIIINTINSHVENKGERMPFRNQYPARLMPVMPMPVVTNAEGRQLLSPAVCAWVGKVGGLRSWAFQRLAAFRRLWVAAVER